MEGVSGMGRTSEVAGGRPNVLTVRLSNQEVATLDRLRGSLSRGAYLRVLVIAASKRNGA